MAPKAVSRLLPALQTYVRLSGILGREYLVVVDLNALGDSKVEGLGRVPFKDCSLATS